MNHAFGAFILLAFIFVVALEIDQRNDSERLRASQVASCKRVNILREQINQQNLAFLAHNEITARAEGLRRERPQYEAIAQFYLILPLTNCARAISDPSYSPPSPHKPTRAELESVLRRLPRVH